MFAQDLSATSKDGETVTITLKGSDQENDELTASTVTLPRNEMLTDIDQSTGTAPKSGFSGTDEFTYKVSDPTHESKPATVSITIESSQAANNKQTDQAVKSISQENNQAPLAQDLSVTTVVDEPIAIILKGSDSEKDELAAYKKMLHENILLLKRLLKLELMLHIASFTFI